MGGVQAGEARVCGVYSTLVACCPYTATTTPRGGPCGTHHVGVGSPPEFYSSGSASSLNVTLSQQDCPTARHVGGFNNLAFGTGTSVSGGNTNTASSDFASVSGGDNLTNVAGGTVLGEGTINPAD